MSSPLIAKYNPRKAAPPRKVDKAVNMSNVGTPFATTKKGSKKK